MEQLYGAVPCRAMLYEANAPGAALRVSQDGDPAMLKWSGAANTTKTGPGSDFSGPPLCSFKLLEPPAPPPPPLCPSPLHPRVGGLHRHGIKQKTKRGPNGGQLGSWAGSEQPFAKQRSSAVCVCACGRAFDHTWCVCCGNPPDTIWRNPSQRALARVLVGCREVLTAQPR